MPLRVANAGLADVERSQGRDMVSVLAERSIGLASSWSEFAVALCVDNRRMIARALAALQLSDDHKDL